MRISDWSSDVCSSDLLLGFFHILLSEALIMTTQMRANPLATPAQITAEKEALRIEALPEMQAVREKLRKMMLADPGAHSIDGRERSEEHTSELQSLMRISYSVFCLEQNREQHTI